MDTGAGGKKKPDPKARLHSSCYLPRRSGCSSAEPYPPGRLLDGRAPPSRSQQPFGCSESEKPRGFGGRAPEDKLLTWRYASRTGKLDQRWPTSCRDGRHLGGDIYLDTHRLANPGAPAEQEGPGIPKVAKEQRVLPLPQLLVKLEQERKERPVQARPAMPTPHQPQDPKEPEGAEVLPLPELLTKLEQERRKLGQR